jgi:hypothetical protein
LSLQSPDLESGRPPRLVREGLWLFAPSRDSQGGSSWLVEGPGAGGDILVDCPAWNQANLAVLAARPGPGTIVLTGRLGHGRCRRFQEALGWDVLVQEQEAYLLPGMRQLTSFGAGHQLGAGVRLLWTPDPAPEPACCTVPGATGTACSVVGCCTPWPRASSPRCAAPARSTGAASWAA